MKKYFSKFAYVLLILIPLSIAGINLYDKHQLSKYYLNKFVQNYYYFFDSIGKAEIYIDIKNNKSTLTEESQKRLDKIERTFNELENQMIQDGYKRWKIQKIDDAGRKKAFKKIQEEHLKSNKLKQ